MGTIAEYDSLDGLALASLVRRGEATPLELLETAIARVEARDKALNAVVMKLYDHGRAAIAAGLPDGPFRGVPFLLKDLNGALGGVRTTRGSRFFADATPPVDAEFTTRLKRAGLVIFGKTNTPELGLSVACESVFWGAARNPWDLERTPGGSSGGASAAVAARIVPIAHAADGFGSIRVPAACCGLVGLKPTRARNSLAPFVGEAMAGGVAEFVLSRSVRDSAAMLDATCGEADGDPYAAPARRRPYLDEVGAEPGRLRIAVADGAANGAAVEPECRDALMDAARLCAGLGHAVEEAAPECDGPAAWRTFQTLMTANILVNLRNHPTAGRLPREDEVERVTFDAMERGKTVAAADYIAATQAAHRLGRQFGAFHRRFDVLLTPALGTKPPKTGWLSMMQDPAEYWRRIEAFTPFSVWSNLTGQPEHDHA